MEHRGFATIHIFDAEQIEISVCLGSCQFGNQYFSEDQLNTFRDTISKADDFAKVAETIQFISQFPAKMATFYTVATGKWASICSDYIGPENVDHIAQTYFEDIKKDVIAFSSDLSNEMHLSHFRHGTLLSSICKTGKDTESHITNRTMRLLNISDVSVVTNLLMLPVPQMIQQLSCIFGFPLVLYKEDIHLEESNVSVDEFFL